MSTISVLMNCVSLNILVCSRVNHKAGMGSSSTVLDLEDNLRRNICGLGLGLGPKGTDLDLGLDLKQPWL